MAKSQFTIVFYRVSPKASWVELLHQNGFETQSLSKLPAKEDHPHMVIAQLGEKTSTKSLLKIRQKFQDSWLVLLCPLKLIQRGSIGEKPLLEVADDLWDETQWEKRFLVGLERMLKFNANQKKVVQYERDLNLLEKENHSVLKQSDKLIEDFERDLKVASQIQKAILPVKFPQHPGIQITSKFVAASGPGGNYFDVFDFGDKKRLGILIADSKSHGIVATLLTVLIKLRIQEMKEKFEDTKSFVAFLNGEIQSLYEANMTSLALFYGVLDKSNMHLQYTVAGDISPLLWRMGEFAPLQIETNPAMGTVEVESYKENFLNLKRNDLLFFHTPGLVAPLCGKGEEFKSVLSAIFENQHEGLDILGNQNEILSRIAAHKENTPLHEDITLLQIAITPNALFLAK